MATVEGVFTWKNRIMIANPPVEVPSKRDSRREAILDVARDVFLATGYAASSMSTIAARLGGSKSTLYNYFKNKDDLFAACISRHCAWQSDAMFSILVGGRDVRSTLTTVAHNYLMLVLSDNNMNMFRLVVAESARDPEIGVLFYESGPQRGLFRLSEFLAERTALNELSMADAWEAAQTLIALCINRQMTMRLCNYAPAPSQEQVALEVDRAIESFMTLYAPRR